MVDEHLKSERTKKNVQEIESESKTRNIEVDI